MTALSRPIAAPSLAVRLLGGFDVIWDRTLLTLPQDAQRLVAFLGLESRTVTRGYVAGRLWPDSSQQRAYGNLRSALWRVRRESGALIQSDGHSMRLLPSASVDVAGVATAARRLSDPDVECQEGDYDHLRFVGELLPGWYDEWTVIERERLRQVCLHALEALAIDRLGRGRYAAGLEAALAAIALEPLRESPHRIVVRIHLAEGNVAEAIRHYREYATMLQAEMGLLPTRQLTDLLSVSGGQMLLRP